ncbi:MAG TPA: amidohydrolase family protein, partial [Bacillota bacterium]|nr:amidohydrolase family protein [Bacillota bacterium]
MKAIVNARIIKDNSIFDGYTVLFEEKILRLMEGNALKGLEPEEVFDAAGRYLSPGFIDVHIHGCIGNDTMDDNESSLRNISKAIAATGVTAILPTTMTMGFPMIEKSINRIRTLMDDAPGASILGCHLEGPFISEEYKGAQDGKYIRRPDFKTIEGLSDVIRIVTIAPEEEGAEEFIES